MCFAAVEFEDDPNVQGYSYWYLCDFDVKVGDKVAAPLGRHNRIQQGTVRKVKFADEDGAPFPLHSIKRVKSVAEDKVDVQNS